MAINGNTRLFKWAKELQTVTGETGWEGWDIQCKYSCCRNMNIPVLSAETRESPDLHRCFFIKKFYKVFAWNTIASSLQTIFYLLQLNNVWQCHKAEQLKRWEVRSHISPPSWNGLWDCRASRKPLMLYFTRQKWAQHCHCVTRQSCLSSVIALGSHWAERAVLLVTSVHTPQALRATKKVPKQGLFECFCYR